MHRLTYQGAVYECHDGETVIEAFLRQGVNIPFSCRNGICHVCLRRSVRGAPPPAARKGLRPTLQERGYFLPCKCVPEADMEIEPPRDADLYSPAIVHVKELLAPDVCRVLLEPATALYYRAGQFINLRRADGLTRSYSLASVPKQDYFLELHVKRMLNGEMSHWVFDVLEAGDEVEIQGPQGGCYYVPGAPEQNLLLVGTGTGLAPLMGIVRDALASRHAGAIHLYHGSGHRSGLYFRESLLDLAQRHANFRYTACISREAAQAGYAHGRAHDVALAVHADLRGWRVYFSGFPEMVYDAQARALRAGAPPSEIIADPYEYKDLRREARTTGAVAATASPSAKETHTNIVPDPEMWAALREGELLSEILTDFYTRVFDDPMLAPYFQNVTKRRLIEKVFLFMRTIFTGEKIYFGERPRNAHNWMVISDEIFDHREELMTSCLRAHGLDEHLVQRWRRIEESFRGDVVKVKPWCKIMEGGVELPLDGYGEAVIDVGTLCDACMREIAPGEKVRYHLRLGTTYCGGCAEPGSASPPAV